MRVLIVEHNRLFAQLVAERFEQDGIASDRVETAEQAERAIAGSRYAAIVLDPALSDRPGLTLLRAMRARGNATPVLVTSSRHGLEDRLHCLREGADDYLPKPFSIDELIARLRAILRRPANLATRTITAGNVLLDIENRGVRIDDVVHPMRLRETIVLELLMQHLGQVVPRGHMVDRLFGLDGDQGDNTLDVYIHRLRRQLLDTGATVLIHTVHGVGHMMTVSPSSDSARSKSTDARCA